MNFFVLALEAVLLIILVRVLFFFSFQFFILYCGRADQQCCDSFR